MGLKSKGTVEISVEELNKILQAYHTIGSFLEHYVKPELLYKEEFTKGMDEALSEVARQKTQKVETFKDFISQLHHAENREDIYHKGI